MIYLICVHMYLSDDNDDDNDSFPWWIILVIILFLLFMLLLLLLLFCWFWRGRYVVYEAGKLGNATNLLNHSL